MNCDYLIDIPDKVLLDNYIAVSWIDEGGGGDFRDRGSELQVVVNK